MTRVGLRGIRAHLVRFALSLLAVALGVSFVAGTFSLREMLSATFSDIVDTTMVGDAYLRGVPEVDGGSTAPGDIGFSAARTRVPLSAVPALEAVDGVQSVVPDVIGGVVLVGADGTAVLNGQAPSLGVGWSPDDPAVHVSDGRAPRDPGEVALETVTLETSGLSVGDTTSVVVGGELHTVRVVGEVSGTAPLAGATMTYFDLATATAAFAPDGRVDTIAVHARDGVGETDLVERLESVVVDPAMAGARAEVVTGDRMRAESRESIESTLGFVNTFLLVFAAISLFVGGFIIANTFAMSVRQRMRELALLRAMGASPTQVFGSVLVQAAVVGVVGSLLGVAGGVGLVSVLRVVFEGMGMDLGASVPLDVRTVVVSVLVGTVVAIVAAALPARRAAVVPPVEAMREDVVDVEGSLRVRGSIGALLLVIGAAGVGLAALAPDSFAWVEEHPAALLGIGAGAVVLGGLAVAPVVARTTLGVLAAPVVRGLRPVGALARGNVTRSPRRTAGTAGALMIGMALVSAAAVLAGSTQASVGAIVDDELKADLLIQSATTRIPDEAVQAVADADGVGSVDVLTFGQVQVAVGADAPERLGVVGVDPMVFDRSVGLTVVDGSLTALDAGQVGVKRASAEQHGWQVGDVLTLTADGRSVTRSIGAVLDGRSISAPLVLPSELYDDVMPATAGAIDTVFVNASPGTTTAQLRETLTDTLRPYVVLSVLDAEDFASELAAQVDQVLVILYALLGLSLVIAVLGIVNTLALSVIERTREIGLLRAVGLGRLQLAGTVAVESVLTAVFGTVLGLAVGVGLASAMPAVLADEGLTQLAVPWESLGLMLGLAVVVGLLAALWPAVRAARLPVLDAVSYE